MVAQPLHGAQIFLRPDTLSAVEVVMLTGFFLVFIFDIASVTWLSNRGSRLKSHRTGNLTFRNFKEILKCRGLFEGGRPPLSPKPPDDPLGNCRISETFKLATEGS